MQYYKSSLIILLGLVFTGSIIVYTAEPITAQIMSRTNSIEQTIIPQTVTRETPTTTPTMTSPSVVEVRPLPSVSIETIAVSITYTNKSVGGESVLEAVSAGTQNMISSQNISGITTIVNSAISPSTRLEPFIQTTINPPEEIMASGTVILGTPTESPALSPPPITTNPVTPTTFTLSGTVILGTPTESPALSPPPITTNPVTPTTFTSTGSNIVTPISPVPIPDSRTIADNEPTVIFDFSQRHEEIIINSSNTILTRIIVTEQTDEPRINFRNILNATNDNTNTVTYPNELEMDVVFNDITANIVIQPQTRMGSDQWNGIMNLPRFVESNTVNVESREVTSVLEIGLDNDILTFDRPVRIVFDGRAGQDVGYEQGREVTIIEQRCEADDIGRVFQQLVGDRGECKIDVGSDLVVWTMHFTRFFTAVDSLPLNVPTPPTLPTPGGGGSNSGSVGIVSSGGGHKTTSVLAANMVSYNTCDQTKNGVVRILAFNSPHVSNIKASVYSKDFMSSGVDVTATIPPNTYLENAKSNYVYTVFDAKLPADTKKFFVTLSNVDDIRQTSSTLIDLTDSSATSCADTIFPHPLRDSTTVFRPSIEPITVNTVAVPLEQLRLEITDNSIMFENNPTDSSSFVAQPTDSDINTVNSVVELETETPTLSNVPAIIDETAPQMQQNTQQQQISSSTVAEKQIESTGIVEPATTESTITQNNIIKPPIADVADPPSSIQKNIIVEPQPTTLTATDPSIDTPSLPTEPVPKESVPPTTNSQQRTSNVNLPSSSPNTAPATTLDSFIQEQRDSIEFVSSQFFTWLDNLFD